MNFQPISEFKPHTVTNTSNVSELYLLVIREQDSINEKDYALAYSLPSVKVFSIVDGGIINFSNFKSNNGHLEALEFKKLPRLKKKKGNE